MERAPAQPRLFLSIDSNVYGVKPRNVARIPSLVIGPRKRTEEPRTPRAGLLFDESSLSPKKGDSGASLLSDRIALARAMPARKPPSNGKNSRLKRATVVRNFPIRICHGYRIFNCSRRRSGASSERAPLAGLLSQLPPIFLNSQPTTYLGKLLLGEGHLPAPTNQATLH
jgi:hypothetical protein